MASNITKIGEAIHRVVEEALKKGVPVSNRRRRRTAAEAEAVRLRVEQASREKSDFVPARSVSLTDDSPFYMPDSVGKEDDGLTNPTVLTQLSTPSGSLSGYSIMEEIAEARLTDKMKPFVEGEPIGACRNAPKPEAAPSLKTRNEIMDDRQKALRERQQQNDRTLERMSERLR